MAGGSEAERDAVVLDRSGDVVATIRAEQDQVITSVSFSSDGRRLATTREGVVRIDPTNMPVTIWDWASGEVVRTIDAAAQDVAFDPTGAMLATARAVEPIVDVWDAASGERLATISPAAPISALAFAPDGARLATAHPDGTVRIWDPRTGVLRLTLRGGAGEIVFLAFSPDGKKLATNGDDLTRVWALDLEDLVAIANARLLRGFTDGECRQYLHVDRCPAD
jgi:WD40 repeat protein